MLFVCLATVMADAAVGGAGYRAGDWSSHQCSAYRHHVLLGRAGPRYPRHLHTRRRPLLLV